MKFGSNVRWKEERKKYTSPCGCAWHKVFAWFPVSIDIDGEVALERYAWLEYVEKRYPYGQTYDYPEYRELKCPTKP